MAEPTKPIIGYIQRVAQYGCRTDPNKKGASVTHYAEIEVPVRDGETEEEIGIKMVEAARAKTLESAEHWMKRNKRACFNNSMWGFSSPEQAKLILQTDWVKKLGSKNKPNLCEGSWKDTPFCKK